MGILQTQFLTNQREDGTIQHLIFQMKCHGWFLALAEILDIMTTTNIESMQKQFTLNGTGMLYLVHHTHIDLLPETGDGRHTGGMCVAHGLLYLLRMGVDYHTCSGIHTQDSPSTFEDMCIGQEVHDAVVFVDRYTFAVCHHSGMELSVRQDDTLRVTCRTTGIENVCDIIIRGFLLQFVNLNLTREILA